MHGAVPAGLVLDSQIAIQDLSSTRMLYDLGSLYDFRCLTNQSKRHDVRCWLPIVMLEPHMLGARTISDHLKVPSRVNSVKGMPKLIT